MTDKKLEKIHNILGLETVQELDTLVEENLKNRLIQAEQAIASAVNELEANPAFVNLKESLKDLSQGMKDVKKRQRAIIEYALHLLETKGV